MHARSLSDAMIIQISEPWEFCIQQDPSPFRPYVIVCKIQRVERRAMPQHPRQALSPFIPYVIYAKIQLEKRRALPQHPRQAPSPFAP